MKNIKRQSHSIPTVPYYRKRVLFVTHYFVGNEISINLKFISLSVDDLNKLFYIIHLLYLFV